MQYKQACGTESVGKYIVGVKIMVSTDRELTEEEESVCYKAAQLVQDAILNQYDQLDPENVKEVENTRERIVACFDEPIYVEEIPNGYGDDWYYQNRPWYRVTTKIGRFVLGWRKRVISIDWSDTLVENGAMELFPNENVTRIDQTIHAYSYEKAKEYISKVMQAHENTSSQQSSSA